MTDWEKCPAVESVPGKVSGNSVFTRHSFAGERSVFLNLVGGRYDIRLPSIWFEGVEESTT